MKQSRWVLVAASVACLMASHGAFAQSTRAATAGPACGPTMQMGYYGINVVANTNTGVGSAQSGVQGETLCSVRAPTAAGGKHARAANQYTSMDGSYTYAVTNKGVSVTSELLAEQNNAKIGSGTGSANIIVTWRDMLKVTTAQMRTIAPDHLNPINASTFADAIVLTVHLTADAIQCSGNTQSLSYTTSVIASAVTIVGGAPLGGIANNRGEYSDAVYPRKNVCNIGELTSGTVVALNGYPIFLNLAAQVSSSGGVEAGQIPLSGDVKANISGLNLCIVRPSRPTDLKITSASGKSYWC